MTKKFLRPVENTPPPCTDEDPEMFFPSYTEDARHEVEEAKAVCRSCPLIFDCLEDALEVGDKWAVAGGTTPAERDQLAERRAKKAARSEALELRIAA